MERRAVNQTTYTGSTFSKLDWPTPSTLVPAHRARAQVLREMVTSLGRWARHSFLSPST